MKLNKLFFPFFLIGLTSLCITHVSASEKGVASYYAAKFQGRKTASGQRYDKRKLTAAHNGLAFGSKVKVTNLRNHRSVVVTINDRGAFRKRLIDLSYAAAKKLGFVKKGLAKVNVTVLKP
ncbi:MAG: septal ring lytic transglycosylase RlpA family protein [Methylococcales bacterium]|nr:septal ring lytic transglycosylase RlpA family protein [Methylococcales bacterium]